MPTDPVPLTEEELASVIRTYDRIDKTVADALRELRQLRRERDERKGTSDGR